MNRNFQWSSLFLAKPREASSSDVSGKQSAKIKEFSAYCLSLLFSEGQWTNYPYDPDCVISMTLGEKFAVLGRPTWPVAHYRDQEIWNKETQLLGVKSGA
jgi:hypothetical protein